MLPDCSGTRYLTLCQISALKEAINIDSYDNTIFLKWGTLNVLFKFCSIFVPFHCYLIMTLVVPCFNNIFMVLLISALAKIGMTKPIFLDRGGKQYDRANFWPQNSGYILLAFGLYCGSSYDLYCGLIYVL